MQGIHGTEKKTIIYLKKSWNLKMIMENHGTWKTEGTRQSEMAHTSPRHMPVLDNVHPIKIEKFDIFRDVISLLVRVLYY